MAGEFIKVSVNKSGTTDLKDLLASLEAARDNLVNIRKESETRFLKVATLAIVDYLVITDPYKRKTPIFTGQFLANWKVSIGGASTTTVKGSYHYARADKKRFDFFKKKNKGKEVPDAITAAQAKEIAAVLRQKVIDLISSLGRGGAVSRKVTFSNDTPYNWWWFEQGTKYKLRSVNSNRATQATFDSDIRSLVMPRVYEQLAGETKYAAEKIKWFDKLPQAEIAKLLEQGKP